MTIMRLTGRAGMVHTRTFAAKVNNSTGEVEREAFEMRSQDVEIAPLVTATVDLPQAYDPFAVGDELDIAVDVTVNRGYMRVEPKGNWPKSDAGSHRTPTPPKVPAIV